VNRPDQPPGVDELLDRALHALAEGHRATANRLAEQVLAVDRHNVDAEDLLAAPADPGEIRRITILFADLVDSTALSTRIELETYRTVVGRYRDEVIRIVRHYGGHLSNTKGDGLLAVFGHPDAHEDDVQRAVQAGLDITREVAVLSTRVRRRFGFDIDVRVPPRMTFTASPPTSPLGCAAWPNPAQSRFLRPSSNSPVVDSNSRHSFPRPSRVLTNQSAISWLWPSAT
jgi:Adenylate and Guanylate cyclase catalytic domain